MGGFDDNRYPHFQTSQEFALDGGVSFNSLSKSNECKVGGVLFSELKCSI